MDWKNLDLKKFNDEQLVKKHDELLSVVNEAVRKRNKLSKLWNSDQKAALEYFGACKDLFEREQELREFFRENFLESK